MPGERRVDRYPGGLFVADFSDHDDVRVLAQGAPQAFGEGVAFLSLSLGLDDTFDMVFNRVFDGDDLDFRGVDFFQEGVEGSGLA